MSSAEFPDISKEVTTTDDGMISLVEIELGVAVLFADHPPLDFDLIPFQMRHTESRSNLIDKLAIAVGNW